MTSVIGKSDVAMHQGHAHAAQKRAGAINRMSSTALTSAVSLWFLVTIIGQLIFVIYVIALYGGAAINGNLQGWNAVMPHGYVSGDTAGTIALGAHLLLAAIIMLAGALQLIPQLRTRLPIFHHWNGRVYLTGAVVASLTGVYMIWFRGTVGDVVQHLGTSLNAVLIVLFAGMTLRRALARDFVAHRRWALRLFLSVSGVWFFRIGLMFWIAVNRGPVGFNPETFEGPFLSFLAFAQYIVPLAVLELYLHCRVRNGMTTNLSMATALVGLAIATGIGVVVATMGMWLPKI